MDSPKNSQKTVSSDDEIDYSIKPEFYDLDLDDKDELWMVKKRDGRTSDAVLSCPACFTTVCLECQRHEQYVTQYRAVFVVNCSVGKDRVSQHSTTPSKVGKRRRDSEEQEAGSAKVLTRFFAQLVPQRLGYLTVKRSTISLMSFQASLKTTYAVSSVFLLHHYSTDSSDFDFGFCVRFVYSFRSEIPTLNFFNQISC